MLTTKIVQNEAALDLSVETSYKPALFSFLTLSKFKMDFNIAFLSSIRLKNIYIIYMESRWINHAPEKIYPPETNLGQFWYYSNRPRRVFASNWPFPCQVRIWVVFDVIYKGFWLPIR